MLLKRLAIVLVAGALFVISGCEKQKSDERLIEITVKVEKQKAKVDRIATTLQSINHKLETSQESGKKSAPTSGAAEAAEAAPQEVDFRETPEYGKMVEALSAIQQQLGLMQTDFAETKKEIQRERWRDPDRQWKALNHPKEMTERLDALVENFAQQIDDPLRRQQFEADVQQLRQINSDSLTTPELSQWLDSILNERLNNAQDEEARKWIESQLSNLASPSEGNLDAAVARVRSDINRKRLGEMVTIHGIPSEVLNDAGLPNPNATVDFSYITLDATSGDAFNLGGTEGGLPQKLELQNIHINPKAAMKAESKEKSGKPTKS